MPVEEKENEIRVRVEDPDKYDDRSYARVTLSEEKGIDSIQGCPKGKYDENTRKCKEGLEIQALRFSKDKGWTPETAKAWAEEHDYTVKGYSWEELQPFSVVICDITKADDAERIVEGYASVEAVDLAGDEIIMKAFEEAMDDYMELATILLRHQPLPVGRLVKWEIKMIDGVKKLWIRTQVKKKGLLADITWKLIKQGILKGFSVGGKTLRKFQFCEKGMCWNRISKMIVAEFSYVDTPMNPGAIFTLFKSLESIQKSATFPDDAPEVDTMPEENGNEPDKQAEQPPVKKDGERPPAAPPSLKQEGEEGANPELTAILDKLKEMDSRLSALEGKQKGEAPPQENPAGEGKGADNDQVKALETKLEAQATKNEELTKTVETMQKSLDTVTPKAPVVFGEDLKKSGHEVIDDKGHLDLMAVKDVPTKRL